MNDNTLYYTLSTIPQVLVAFTAIAIAFLFFRIAQIKDFLIGDGITAFERMNRNEKGYAELETKYQHRLRDGIARKNIDEIEDILKMLQQIEINEGFTLITRPNGLQYNYNNRFLPTKVFMNRVLMWSNILLITSTISVLASIISLGWIDLIINCKLEKILLWSNVTLFGLCLSGFVLIITLGLYYKLPYEKGRLERPGDKKVS